MSVIPYEATGNNANTAYEGKNLVAHGRRHVPIVSDSEAGEGGQPWLAYQTLHDLFRGVVTRRREGEPQRLPKSASWRA